MKKQTLAVLLAICMIFIMSLSAYAVSPRWSYMDTVDIDINFIGTSGTADLYVSRISQVTTKIEGTLTVYERVGSSWVYVDSVSDESTRGLSLELDFDAVSGTTYKAVADITAYGASGSEEVYINYTTMPSSSLSSTAGRNKVKTVAAHEMGHVLGLGHVSGTQYIMRDGYNSSQPTTPPDNEKEAIYNLYIYR